MTPHPIRLFAVVALAALAAAASAGGARAELQELQLKTDRDESVRAILAKPLGAAAPNAKDPAAPSAPGLSMGRPAPPGEGRRPAVIFNHGTGVRRDGYEGSPNRGGMNVADFLRALARENYVVLAPIRTILANEASIGRGGITGTPEQWGEVIAYGIRAVDAARRHLAERPDVDPRRIALVGFSEGGNVSLWAASRTPGYRAVVLLAPAAISNSPDYRLGMAAREENAARIGAPVFLAVGANDLPAIRGAVERFLIPNLTKVNLQFRHRTDYPGGHDWFWKVRDEYWNDVTAFLKEHLD